MMKRKSSLQMSLYKEPWKEREKGKDSYCVQVKKDNYDFRLKHIFITMETFWADFDQRQNVTCFSCNN